MSAESGGMMACAMGEGGRQIGSCLCGNGERIGSELWGRRLENWAESLDRRGKWVKCERAWKEGREKVILKVGWFPPIEKEAQRGSSLGKG